MISQALSLFQNSGYIAEIKSVDNKQSRAIAAFTPNHNEHTDEFDLRYCILQGF
jgi:hypothetical protein